MVAQYGQLKLLEIQGFLILLICSSFKRGHHFSKWKTFFPVPFPTTCYHQHPRIGNEVPRRLLSYLIGFFSWHSDCDRTFTGAHTRKCMFEPWIDEPLMLFSATSCDETTCYISGWRIADYSYNFWWLKQLSSSSLVSFVHGRSTALDHNIAYRTRRPWDQAAHSRKIQQPIAFRKITDKSQQDFHNNQIGNKFNS